MKTLDLTGLTGEQVLFLERLIASWKGQPSGTREEDLPPLPAWWQETLERARQSSFSALSKAGIGQLCEELAEEAARDGQAPASAPG